MLRPCTHCRRPVRESTCPFCGGPRDSSQIGTRSAPARLAAAGAVVVAAGLVSESCSSAAVPFYGGPCISDCIVDAAGEDTSGPSFPDVGIPDALVDAAGDADASDGAADGDANDGGTD